ncbi:MAG: hypothetical protein KKA60_03235 [Proteobacteria bacterium]|nr:hypothetical protein [Pseudomonadota bacterium]
MKAPIPGCEDCPLEEKILVCCGVFPETGESRALPLPDGGEVPACTHLSAGGFCAIYEQRPPGCRRHECPALAAGAWARGA